MTTVPQGGQAETPRVAPTGPAPGVAPPVVPSASPPSLFSALIRDAARYRGLGAWWRHLGFWVVALYRLAAAARAFPVPGVREALLVAAWLLRLPFRMVLHLELPSRTRVGPGLLLLHPFNVLIGSEVVIGEDCSIFHEVTLGAGVSEAMPVLGDRVVVFPGARIFGGVTIGDAAEIGANCVVTRDVPPKTMMIAPLPRAVPQSLVPRASTPPGERGP